MDERRKSLYEQCRKKLIQSRQEIMNGLKSLDASLQVEITGDEGDMAQALEGQHTSMMQREKMLYRMKEIDLALQRIEDGAYGICEETEEPIEGDRLLAIPWTRLSSEGAEIREQMSRRHVG